MAAKKKPKRKGRSGEEAPATPLRSCLATRRKSAPDRLVRLAAGPGGELVADLAGRLPGRGAYVMPERAAAASLFKKRGMLEAKLGRALVWPDREAFLDGIGEGLDRRLMDRIGLCLRAGGLRFGVDELKAAAGAGERVQVILAADVADNTREKVERVIRMKDLAPAWEILDRERLGQACGRAPAAVVFAAPGGWMQGLEAETARWLSYQKRVTGKREKVS